MFHNRHQASYRVAELDQSHVSRGPFLFGGNDAQLGEVLGALIASLDIEVQNIRLYCPSTVADSSIWCLKSAEDCV